MLRWALALSLVGALLAASGISAASHTNMDNPDPCPEPWVVAHEFETEQDAVKALRKLGFRPSPTPPGLLLPSQHLVLENDYTKPTAYKGHPFGAYRLHGHAFEATEATAEQYGADNVGQLGTWFITIQGPEPSPYRPWHFGGLVEGFNYVRWWHWFWEPAAPYDDGNLGC